MSFTRSVKQIPNEEPYGVEKVVSTENYQKALSA